MSERNLAAEQEQVNKYIQVQGRAPSTADEWQTIHTAVYGNDLPNDPAIQRAWQAPASPTVDPNVSGAQANATATTADGQPLMYQGTNVSDTAIAGAQKAYEPWTQPNNFLDKVKQRLQAKFKPETETLGLGAFSATLGALDPTGVMAGINEKSGQFRKKGALALQALSTAGQLYSEQAQISLDKLNNLEEKRGSYETEQKTVENEFKGIALDLVKNGQTVPDDILNMLSPQYKTMIQSLGDVYKQAEDNDRITNAKGTGEAGWHGDELNLGYGGQCGVVARNVWSTIDAAMGDTLDTKMAWINKYGTKGTSGIGVGDLVITDGSDLTGGKTIGSGHALMVGAMDKDGNIYAYESNAKGDGKITFGRWVDPSAIYGYVGQNSKWGNSTTGVMKPEEFAKMQKYAMEYNPALKGATSKGSTTTTSNSMFDPLLSKTDAEARATLEDYAQGDKAKFSSLLQKFNAYKAGKASEPNNMIANEYEDFTKSLSTKAKTNFLSLNAEDQSTVKQLVNGDALLSDLVTSRGADGTKERQRLLALAQGIDPNFSESVNKARTTFVKRWESGNLWDNRNAINTALGHLATLKTQSLQLDNTTLQKYNNFANMFKKETGNPDVSTFKQTLYLLAEETAKVYKGGASPTEDEIQMQFNAMSSDYSPKQLDALINNVAHLMSSKVTTMASAYKKTMGRDYSQSLIDQEKMDELKAAGVDTSLIKDPYYANQPSNANWDNYNPQITIPGGGTLDLSTFELSQ